MTQREIIPTFAARKRGKESVAKREESKEAGAQKNKKNKFWESKKGSYLCNPKTNEAKAENREQANRNGRLRLKREMAGKQEMVTTKGTGN